jgi:hypothetical protein
MFIIEDYDLENPNWDRSTDTLETLNLEFHVEATEALVAGTMHLASEQPWER